LRQPKAPRRSSGRSVALAILLVVGMTATAAAETPGGTPCDFDFVRAQAEETIPDYHAELGRSGDGFVTVRFTARNGDGIFAIALYAVGTHLTTSTAARSITDAELRHVTEPIESWWQREDLQQMLAACTVGAPEGTAVELRAAARNALALATDNERPPDLAPLAWWIAHERLTFLFGSAWIVLAALLCPILAHAARSRTERTALVVVFAASLALNALLCVGGPGDLRLNLAATWWRDGPELHWGPAPVGLFRLLELVLGMDDLRIKFVNMMLSSFVPVMTFAIVVTLGVHTIAALVAAFVVAAHPFLIAFSSDLSRQPTLLFAMFASALGLVDFLKRGGATTFGAFVLGTVLAITSRPEGVHVLIVHAAMLAFVPSTGRRRAGAGVVLGVIAGFASVYVLSLLEYGRAWANETHLQLPNDPTAPLWTIVLDRDFTPAAWILAWTVGLALGIRRRAAWMALCMLVALHIAWSKTGVYASFVGYDRQVASSRYQAVLLLPFAIGIALFAESIRTRGTRTALIVATLFTVFTIATYERAYDTLLTPFTVDYEYRFLRRHVLTLPPEARVYTLEPPANDIGFVDASLVPLFVHRDLRFARWDLHRDREMPRGTETYLYIGSECAPIIEQHDRPLGEDFPQWLRDCSALRTRLAADAVEEIDVPAHKMSWYEFTQPTVRLGLYRLPPG
jgi:hypothetical protein